MTIEEQKELWKQILTKLEPMMRSSDFRTWLKNTAILVLEHDTLTVGCPSEIVRTQLAAKHHDLIIKAAKKLNPEIAHIDYKVDISLAGGGERTISPGSIIGTIKRTMRREQVEGVKVSEILSTRVLNPDYTFDNFIVGAEDRLALAAAQAVADKPGRAYNPLFVYGGVGLGKTHLLQAIGNSILKKQKDKIVIYTTSEKFTNDVIGAIRGGIKKIEQLRNHYRKIDVLIVDDVQFFGNKKQTQEEFFHTFNVLREADKQIVLAADRPPRELIGIDERLISRFQSGMIVDVYMPPFETRVAILQKFAADENIALSGEILDLIANNVKSSIRDLRGAITQIAAHIMLSTQPGNEEWLPTKSNVIDILIKNGTKITVSKSASSELTESLRIDDFIHATAGYFQIDIKEIIGESRKKELANARAIAMWLARHELKYGFEKIGHAFGNRNHATVMHAIRKIDEETEREPNGSLAEQLKAIKRNTLEEKQA
ncbi:MAG: chromosomal replication initiator protein DnaA [Patescibacteria group bacterium]|nr:chromosomal replication initiator protein DnaA [Patescibacteria group bacterium]